jgi:glyoxalase superfamily protein
MGLLVDCLAIDCADPAGLARFWAEVLDYKNIPGDDPDEAAIVPKDGRGTQLLFFRVPDGKSVKNRLHLDLRPEDQAAEVERVLALGARRVDIGQGSPSWVVLADPEGNELCILRSLTPEEKAKPA